MRGERKGRVVGPWTWMRRVLAGDDAVVALGDVWVPSAMRWIGNEEMTIASWKTPIGASSSCVSTSYGQIFKCGRPSATVEKSSRS